MYLLNPGPVNLTDAVRAALAGPAICHREPEYAALQAQVRAGLSSVYEWPDATVVLLGGSGTAAVEAMVASVVPPTGRLVVAVNGVYGERIVAMAEAYGMDHVVVAHDCKAALDPDRIAAALPGATHLAAVHHETTTGRLNPLSALADLASANGVKLLVDGVSSFGAEPIDPGHPALVAVAATANKCLHGAPGLAFVAVRRDALAASTRRGVYLDLKHHAETQERDSTAFTPAIPAVAALAVALRELAAGGGWRTRQRLYRARAARLRDGVAGRGLVPLVPASEAASSLTTFVLPAGLTDEAVHHACRQAGYVIYRAQGSLAGRHVRLANMGELPDAAIDGVIEVLTTL